MGYVRRVIIATLQGDEDTINAIFETAKNMMMVGAGIDSMESSVELLETCSEQA